MKYISDDKALLVHNDIIAKSCGLNGFDDIRGWLSVSALDNFKTIHVIQIILQSSPT